MIDWAAIMPAEQEPKAAEVPGLVQVQEPEKASEAGRSREAAAVPQNLCAQVEAEQGTSYPAHPAAVLLVMAWSRLRGASPDERAALLLNLEGMPPADQVRHWHGVCLLDGLNPWRVLYLPAPQWGDDCTRCAHLMTREDVIGDDRRRYHWACRHGYLILEHGRGTERLYVAPPECHSFDRWYPSEQR